MDAIVLRGRITEEGRVELLESPPEGFNAEQDVLVILNARPAVYQTVNEYGDPVIVDEEYGSVSPLEPLNPSEWPAIGMWADRRDEMKSGAEWIKKMRQEEDERHNPWRGRTIS